MIMSTVVDFPGRPYHVIGIVYSEGSLTLHDAISELERKATDYSADAVLDVRLYLSEHPGGHRTGPMYTMLGTAIKFYQRTSGA